MWSILQGKAWRREDTPRRCGVIIFLLLCCGPLLLAGCASTPHTTPKAEQPETPEPPNTPDSAASADTASPSSTESASPNENAVAAPALPPRIAKRIGTTFHGTDWPRLDAQDPAKRRRMLLGSGAAPLSKGSAPAYMRNLQGLLTHALHETPVRILRFRSRVTLILPADKLFGPNAANAVNDTVPDPRHDQWLTAIANVLATRASTYVDVHAHTDTSGEATTNMARSVQRAEAVASALGTRGVTPARLAIQGHGETRPAADTQTTAGQAANRRIEIVLTPLM